MRDNLCSGASNLNFLSNEAASLTMAVRLKCWKSYEWDWNGKVRYRFDFFFHNKIQEKKEAMALLLTNDALQVNFNNICKIIIHGPFVPGSAVIIIILPNSRDHKVK